MYLSALEKIQMATCLTTSPLKAKQGGWGEGEQH